MFQAKQTDKGALSLIGRFDASQVEKANSAFDKVEETTVVDLKELEYISSAGMGVLLATQKRLKENGQQLKLVRMNDHIRDVFRYAGFDMIFEIE